MTTDFTGRPDHPDFWLLSEIVQDLDAASDDVDIDRLIAPTIDPESLVYVAIQRILRAMMAVKGYIDPDMLAALWVDAFTAGALYQKRKTANDA